MTTPARPLVDRIEAIGEKLFEASWKQPVVRSDWLRWVIYVELMEAIQGEHACKGDQCWCQGDVFKRREAQRLAEIDWR